MIAALSGAQICATIVPVPPDSLSRFVDAQKGTFVRAVAELAAGRKQGHWMWFVFPQLRGLGRSAAALQYGIGSLAEAGQYLDHPILGQRYDDCCVALSAWKDQRGAVTIFGEIDAIKLRSSLTLFEAAAAGTSRAALYGELLDAFFGGARDPLTKALLEHER